MAEKKHIKDKTYEEFFESVWKLYPKKEGKGSVSKTQKEKLQAIGYEEITRCIERYLKAKAGVDRQYLKQGSTFFNSGYVDYLDKNWAEPEAPKSKYRDLSNYEPG
jgi:tRNA A37 N6-isopentenylltransferase MiaA